MADMADKWRINVRLELAQAVIMKLSNNILGNYWAIQAIIGQLF
jgi:hypothetical protein